MSTICLAAQRSYATGEAVWFSYRLPSLQKIFGILLLWMAGLCAMLVAGVYAHVYWNMRHPAPPPQVKVSVAKPETQLSDMHYVYVSKPFPHPQPKPAPVRPSVQESLPPMQDLPINDADADWQQAPDGDMPRDIQQEVPHDTSRDTLPGTEAHAAASDNSTEEKETNDDASLKALFEQALKEQQKDFAQGKMPAPPVDETQDNSQQKWVHQDVKKSPFSEKGDRLE